MHRSRVDAFRHRAASIMCRSVAGEPRLPSVNPNRRCVRRARSDARATKVIRHGLWPMLRGRARRGKSGFAAAWRSSRPRCSAAGRCGCAIAGNPTARSRPARSARPSESRGCAAKRSSASTSLAMPTSGRRISPSTSRPPGFSSRRITAKRGIEFVRRHVLRDRIHHREIDRLLGHLPQVVQRAHADLGVRRKTRDQPAAHAGRGLGQDRACRRPPPPAPPTAPRRRHSPAPPHRARRCSR